jgi:hypothetical protein
MPTLSLDKRAAKAPTRITDVINVVDEAFGICAEGKGEIPATTCLFLGHADFRAMIAVLRRRVDGKTVNAQSREPISCFIFDAESGTNL